MAPEDLEKPISAFGVRSQDRFHRCRGRRIRLLEEMSVGRQGDKLAGSGGRLDMPDLIMKVANSGERVVAYEHQGEWIDIGQPEDLARAQKMFK